MGFKTTREFLPKFVIRLEDAAWEVMRRCAAYAPMPVSVKAALDEMERCLHDLDAVKDAPHAKRWACNYEEYTGEHNVRLEVKPDRIEFFCEFCGKKLRARWEAEIAKGGGISEDPGLKRW